MLNTHGFVKHHCSTEIILLRDPSLFIFPARSSAVCPLEFFADLSAPNRTSNPTISSSFLATASCRGNFKPPRKLFFGELTVQKPFILSQALSVSLSTSS